MMAKVQPINRAEKITAIIYQLVMDRLVAAGYEPLGCQEGAALEFSVASKQQLKPSYIWYQVAFMEESCKLRWCDFVSPPKKGEFRYCDPEFPDNMLRLFGVDDESPRGVCEAAIAG